MTLNTTLNSTNLDTLAIDKLFNTDERELVVHFITLNSDYNLLKIKHFDFQFLYAKKRYKNLNCLKVQLVSTNYYHVW